jgi:hypothetical protein
MYQMHSENVSVFGWIYQGALLFNQHDIGAEFQVVPFAHVFSTRNTKHNADDLHDL